jgi:tryptophan-rich sensory protein
MAVRYQTGQTGNSFQADLIHMSFALYIVLGLLGLCPAVITLDGAVISSFIPLLVSAGLIVVAIKLPQSEAQHLARVFPRPLVVIAAVPALLMLVQMLPLQFLANPVWTSVSAAFPRGITGSISVDIGATAISLSRYLSVVGAVVLSAAVSTDRSRAEVVLAGGLASIVLVSLAFLSQDMTSARFSVNREEALDCACLGVTLASACGILVFERYERRRYKPNQNPKNFMFGALLSVIAFLICAGAVAVTRSGPVAFAAVSGLLTFWASVVIRRFRLGRFGAAAIGVTAVTIAATLVAVAATDSDPRFAFVKNGTTVAEITRRILADAPFFGDGAGAFSALAPIYRSSGAGPEELGVLAAAAQLSIEMGQVTLWIAIMMASFVVYVLLRGAAHRGRDSFYAAGAGACIVTLMLLAFVSIGLAGQGLILLSAIILGLGLTQSKSRVLT